MSVQSTVTVGTDPTPLFTPAQGVWGYELSIAVDGEQSPGGVVYIGSSDVSATGDKKGRRLGEGTVLGVGMNPSQGRRGGQVGWYAVASTGEVKVSVLVIHGG